MDPRISTFFKLSLTCFITIYAMPFVDISGNKKKVLRAPFFWGGGEKIFIAIYSSHYRENQIAVRYNSNFTKKK